jgi:subfamily B ATP-binding cassette protein MsbA
VTQEITMFNDTIAANVSFWDDRAPVGVRERVRAALHRASCDFLDQLPSAEDTQVGDRGVNLSVGQRQRIAIARELYRDPDILIFDEATSALDSESEQAIQRSMEAMRGTKTMMIIAHRLSTIRHADHIVVIDDGRVAEEGTFRALYDRPGSLFRAMCDRQNFL